MNTGQVVGYKHPRGSLYLVYDGYARANHVTSVVLSSSSVLSSVLNKDIGKISELLCNYN